MPSRSHCLTGSSHRALPGCPAPTGSGLIQDRKRSLRSALGRGGGRRAGVGGVQAGLPEQGSNRNHARSGRRGVTPLGSAPSVWSFPAKREKVRRAPSCRALPATRRRRWRPWDPAPPFAPVAPEVSPNSIPTLCLLSLAPLPPSTYPAPVPGAAGPRTTFGARRERPFPEAVPHRGKGVINHRHWGAAANHTENALSTLSPLRPDAQNAQSHRTHYPARGPAPRGEGCSRDGL